MTKQDDDSRDSDPEAIKKFLQDLSIDIDDISEKSMKQYLLAFTHGSATDGKESYERLEWLGDRVLNLIAAGYLYDTYEELAEGDLSKKLECVSNNNLQKIIAERGLFPENIIRKSVNVIDEQIVADVFEAMVGATYLDQGFEKAKEVVLEFLQNEIEDFDPDQNYKGRLQEHFQKGKIPIPQYETTQSGPKHKPTFNCVVTVGNVKGNGTGPRKIKAEQSAAQEALEKLRETKNLE